MSECICVSCSHQCAEYIDSVTSDKAYYEWTRKEEKCDAEDELMFRANRLAEPPAYIKGYSI